MRILEEMSIEFGAPVSTLERIVLSAPIRYKSFKIDKRSKGKRVIAQPDRIVKALQRYVLANKLEQFEVSNIAMAYVSKRGILENAKMHVDSDYILKLDFSNFFHSILPQDFVYFIQHQKNSPIIRSDLQHFVPLLFWGRGTREPQCLSIGAPTSPAISNILLHDFDQKIIERAAQLDLIVSRYADDITVSGSSASKLRRFERSLSSLLSRQKSPRLTLNDEKRGLYSRGQKRMVTGLILTPDGQISIGRDRKKEIKALINKIKYNEASPAETYRTKGLLAFCFAVEPVFVSRLQEKYGNLVIEKIKKFEDEEFMIARQIYEDRSA